MTYNRRFVLICMALLLSVSATYAQSGCSATKTYSGKFSLNNMAGGYVNNKDWLDGAATYQYRDASDGSRIFDGDFEFTKLRVSAKGRFYNNCQDGKWEWHYGNGVKSEIIFRNKKPNGKFKVYSPNKTALYIQGEIFEGLLQNEFVYVNEKVRVSGKFDVGKPVGVWVYNSDRYPSAKAVYDRNGNLIEDWSYEIVDKDTGNRKRIKFDPDKCSPQSLRGTAMFLLKCHLLRNT